MYNDAYYIKIVYYVITSNTQTLQKKKNQTANPTMRDTASIWKFTINKAHPLPVDRARVRVSKMSDKQT